MQKTAVSQLSILKNNNSRSELGAPALQDDESEELFDEESSARISINCGSVDPMNLQGSLETSERQTRGFNQLQESDPHSPAKNDHTTYMNIDKDQSSQSLPLQRENSQYSQGSQNIKKRDAKAIAKQDYKRHINLIRQKSMGTNSFTFMRKKSSTDTNSLKQLPGSCPSALVGGSG
jgi:hypothetical protein